MENQSITQRGATPNHYYASGTATTLNVDMNDYLQIQGNATWGNAISIGGGITLKKSGIHPELYFKYIKKKFGTLERMRLDSRLKKLEKAFDKAVESGQEVLARKFLSQVARESRESALYAKGIRHFIERDDLVKHKHNIRDGHISDTMLKDFTRLIPEKVLEKKKKVEDVFDDYVIYHYWDEKAAAKAEKKEKMTPDEKMKMRDPILFGIIRESNRLYFIADWIDEFCDLTFDELIDKIGKDDEEITLTREPHLSTSTPSQND